MASFSPANALSEQSLDRLSSELISSIRLMEVDHPDPIYIHPRVRGQPIIIWGGLVRIEKENSSKGPPKKNYVWSILP